jgi:hypothetical protein
VTSEGTGLIVKSKIMGHEIIGSTHTILKPGNVFYGGNNKQIGLREAAHSKFGKI